MGFPQRRKDAKEELALADCFAPLRLVMQSDISVLSGHL